MIVLAVVSVAILAAYVARKLAKPVHPKVTVGEVGDRPGVVLFTSTDCSNCKEAIATLESASIPFREVAYDLEPHRFETWDVLAVPLTVVVDGDGNVVDAISGVPGRKTLTRAVRTAGIEIR
jgi:thiol-disulfide isomerase/thioredoxin